MKINLAHLALTIQQDKDGVPMPDKVKERLKEIKRLLIELSEVQSREQADAISAEVWKSKILSHFDKMALDPVYHSRCRELPTTKGVKN